MTWSFDSVCDVDFRVRFESRLSDRGLFDRAELASRHFR